MTTTGAVIFALNNSTVDYIKLAIFAANRIQQHLEIPVSIITDSKQWLLNKYPDHPFDTIIEIPPAGYAQQKKFYDGSLSSKLLDWKNLDRHRIYNLTPYDKTLVIDSDYVINSDTLKLALTAEHDFQIYRNSFDLAPGRANAHFLKINQYSIPFYWATVFVFQKNDITQSFFDLITYIKSNWLYFRTLYNINNQLFRNDFAFSIAIHIMNGKTNGEFAVELPGTMTYTTDCDILTDISNDKMQFLVEKKDYLGEYIAVKTSGLDVHVMNKLSLSRIIDGEQHV